MEKKLLLSVVVLLTLTFNAQTNIVVNSSFETHTICPDYPGQINYSTGWNNVNLIYNDFTVGTPDYFHACGSASLGYNTVPPNTFDGVCMPHTGNAMVGTVLYNIPYPDYREYFSTQLSEAMIPGTTYTVSFWITNGNPPQSPFTIKNIGANLSVNPLSQTGWNVINMAPTCEITAYSGSASWVQYNFTVNPVSNFQYITLGSFRNDVSNVPVSTYTGTGGSPAAYAFYFWDDVEVWKPNNTATGIHENLSQNQKISIYPNPANDFIYISSANIIKEISIMNCLGEKILNNKLEETEAQICVKDFPKGIYFIRVIDDKQQIHLQRLIKQN